MNRSDLAGAFAEVTSAFLSENGEDELDIDFSDCDNAYDALGALGKASDKLFTAKAIQDFVDRLKMAKAEVEKRRSQSHNIGKAAIEDGSQGGQDSPPSDGSSKERSLREDDGGRQDKNRTTTTTTKRM